MEYCEAGSLDTIYKKIKLMNGRTGEKVLGKIAESVRPFLRNLVMRSLTDHQACEADRFLVDWFTCTIVKSFIEVISIPHLASPLLFA